MPIAPQLDEGVEIGGVSAPNEIDDLRRVLKEARKSEDEARQDLAVLIEILNLLPVGVKLQRSDGRFLLSNEAAATEFDDPSEALTDASRLREFITEQSTQARGKRFALQSRVPTVTEERLLGRLGERGILTIRKSVCFGDEDLLLSTSLDISDRKQVEQNLEQRANFDELTGLPNRYHIRKQIELLLAQPAACFALAFIDIDNFKEINDYYSHAAGDQLLIKLANRIAANIRSSDILARISGDEFLLLINPIDGNGPVAIVNRIIDCLKAPFFVHGAEIFSTASIGVSAYPEHGRDYETLCFNADSAMYQIKRGAKGGAAMYDPTIRQLGTDRMQAEQQLRLAIQDRRFRCAFQPKVDMATEEVVGVEALIRLLDENGEVHAPGSFIKLATELGLLDELIHLVVCQISESIDLINDAFGPDATISINVGAKQASNVDFMHSFVETLKETNFARRFIVEVTEDAFLAKSQFQMQILPMLRQIAARVSIDDFGTGFSSLSALADITADEIKIDRSFITKIQERPRNQSILRAIESLSSALGMTVVAEGVETFQELAYLRTATGIRYAQGHYFSKPIFLNDFQSTKRLVGDLRRTIGRRSLASERMLYRKCR